MYSCKLLYKGLIISINFIVLREPILVTTKSETELKSRHPESVMIIYFSYNEEIGISSFTS